MKYSNKTVVITGAARGIGKALSGAYAMEGAKVLMLDKDLSALEKTAYDLMEQGMSVEYYVLNLAEPQAIDDTFSKIADSHETVDVLINNAGLGITKTIDDLTVEEWDYVVDTNLRGAFLCSREARKLMNSEQGGVIVNIASTRALMSEANTFPYSASKAGILGLTHSLAVSLGPEKIRVNAISPGWIETGDYDGLRAIDHKQHPAGRVGKPADIVKACFYLTDPDNDFVTGANLVVDGGMTKNMLYEH
jgi:hypothetical protein